MRREEKHFSEKRQQQQENKQIKKQSREQTELFGIYFFQ